MAGFPGSPCWSDERSRQAGALAYTTTPMPRDVTLAGPIDAGLTVRATTRDAELVVAVEDVAPDGSSYPLTGGALLGSHRAVDSRRSWRGPGGGTILPYHPYTRTARRDLEPGRPALIEVEVLPTFARIARGHRLRVTISTAATHLHPSAAQVRDLAGGRYEILHGGARGSFVNLPLANPGALAISPVKWGDCNGGC
jgi:predicted acyl esterase